MSNYKKLKNLCNYNGIAYISNQKFILPNSEVYKSNCDKTIENKTIENKTIESKTIENKL
tara:strand:+ start:823 stop:1002 length:180 start_codon:yes stop_codon:yes gene_type:complete